MARFWSPFLCCVALLACLLIANPFVNSAFNDDWSYSHVALKLAETGSFHYNGWGSPTIVFQSVWAAIWIHLFGFSFNVLRAATLPFSLGFVALTYALGRKAGLHRHFALFSALIVGTSPLFIPLAASFMTEPYACFFTILCIYAAISSAEAPSNSSAASWLWVLAVSGILGGSDRQTVWLAPLVLIPYLGWIKRSQSRFVVQAALAYITCLGSLVFIIHRFGQRYGPMELSKRQLLVLFIHAGDGAAHLVVSVLLTGILMSLPALFCIQPLWKKLPMRHLLLLGLGCVVAFDYLVSGFGEKPGVIPFFGNILTPVGILDPGLDALGFRPLLLPKLLRYEFTLFLLFCIAAWIYFASQRGVRGKFPRTPLSVFILFACAYIPFLFPGALLYLSYDRYVLLLLPLMTTSILLPFQSRVQHVPSAAWACLLAFAGYGVITTHDYFASLRAREEAAQLAVKGGVGKDHISAGLEHDGWTQLQLTGKMKPTLWGDKPDFGFSNKYWFWFYTTAIQPDYVVVCSRMDALPREKILYVPFTAWTVPFRRAAAVVKREDLPNSE